jgi:hypothetical protein
MNNAMSPQELVFGFLSSRLPLSSLPWLEKSANQLERSSEDKVVFTVFSAAIRHSGKGPLSLNESDLAAAKALVPGWNPLDWSIDQAVRIFLLLAMPPTSKSAHLMDLIYQTADLGEALALMKALPLLPNPLDHMARAREGARSNVKSQFEAVALRNPYPADHFDQAAWNHLVSKAIFVDSPLEEITGLDRRANKALNQILMDLVKERQAANRPFSPQLYRCLGPLAEDAELELMENVLQTGTSSERNAVLIGLKLSSSSRATQLLKQHSLGELDPWPTRL